MPLYLVIFLQKSQVSQILNAHCQSAAELKSDEIPAIESIKKKTATGRLTVFAR